MADDPTAAGAERRANRDLIRARCGFGEQHGGHVGAGDHQHDADRGQQDEKGRLSVGGHEVLQACDLDAAAAVGGRVLLLEAFGDRRQLRLRLLDAYTILQAGQRGPGNGAARLLILLLDRVGEMPQRRVVGIRESLRQDPDDGHGPVVDLHRLVQDVGALCHLSAPEVMADHDGSRTGVFVRREEAAHHRRDAEHLEEFRRGANHVREVRGVTDDHCPAAPPVVGQRRERRGPSPPVHDVRERHDRGPRPFRRPGRRERHDAIGIGKGQRLEEHGIDDGEDRGIGADAERQHEHREDRESRIPPKRAQGVADVLPQRLE